MKIFGVTIPFTEKKIDAIPIASVTYSHSSYRYNNLYPVFDGEKTPYELGTPLWFDQDYYSIRLRAWERYIKTDFVQNAIRKYCLWVIGSGLKLQSEPSKHVLENNGIIIGDDKLNLLSKLLEEKFRLYANSIHSSYSGNVGVNLHEQAAEALKNAILSGDVLVVERTINGSVTTQVIDGFFIQTPIVSNYIDEAEKRGNRIVDGVEIDKTGRHVSFYIATDELNYQRILCRGSKTGNVQAWLMYGMKGKISDVRGMSLLTAVMETSAKMDRYKEAAVGKAEENAKVAFTIEHGKDSDGEDPLTQQIATSFGKGKGVSPESETDNGDVIATKIAQSTNKAVYNLPIDSKLVRHADGSDINFSAFWQPNIDIIYATLGIPPEVAADKFGGAYSGSRAALKSWEYKMMVDRVKILKNHFYQPIYNYWLDIQALKGGVLLPGYLQATLDNNIEIIESYRKARFIGAGVPHIDPVKEVNAERIKLGQEMKSVPLTSVEQSIELLGSGDFDDVIKKVSKEKKLFDEIFDINSEPVTE